MNTSYSKYKQGLLNLFKVYRESHFANREELFDDRHSHVFKPEHAQHNLFDQKLIELLPKKRRHRLFGSMGSSQALAVSVFGTIMKRGDLKILTQIMTEDGLPLLESLDLKGSSEFDYNALSLDEPRPTQVDLFIPCRSGNIAIECKLWENGLEPCSQVANRNCNGNYEEQPGRKKGERCYLSERGIAYWKHIPQLFKWPSDENQSPCPIWEPYQLVRNILVASVDPEKREIYGRPKAVLVYDSRNPAFSSGGKADILFKKVKDSLNGPSSLKKVTWQSIITALNQHEDYRDLLSWLDEKYRITPS